MFYMVGVFFVVLFFPSHPIRLALAHENVQVIMVCISDGHANVPLSVSNGEPVSALPPEKGIGEDD